MWPFSQNGCMIFFFLRFVLAFGLLKCQGVYKLFNSNFDCFIQLLSLLISIKGRNQSTGPMGSGVSNVHHCSSVSLF